MLCIYTVLAQEGSAVVKNLIWSNDPFDLKRNNVEFRDERGQKGDDMDL